MAKINDNYLKLKAGYLFPEIGRRVREFAAANPDAKVIRLGIGDVTRPLAPAVLKAFHDAVDDLATTEKLRRLRPGAGLRLADQRHHREILQAARRLPEDRGDVHLRRLQVRLRQHPRHLRPGQRRRHRRPGLPGLQRHQRHDRPHRRGRRQGLLQRTSSTCPAPRPTASSRRFPTQKVDIIYLCFPNNPTGAVATKAELKKWVDYANANDAVIFFDAAYEAFITNPDIPHSIYEIEGAKKCAIEFRSFSKTAGFTGVRCGLVVVPEEVMGTTSTGETIQLQQALAAPHHHQVQRRLLPGAEGRRRGLLRRGVEADQGDHRLLHGERPHHPRRA